MIKTGQANKNMKMWLTNILLLILWSGTLTLAISTPTQDLTVGIDEPRCKYKSDILFCDYKEAEEDVVHMTKTDNEDLRKVFLYNIKRLLLSESVCMNVSLHNVNEVVLVNSDGGPCSKPVEFSAKSCNIDRIPENAKGLYLEDSEVLTLNTSSPLAKLTIINSIINSFQVRSPLVNVTTAILQNSRVDTLHKLTVGAGSSLLIQKSVINIQRKQGLEINKGTVTIKDSSIITHEGGITLRSGGNLAIGNQQGEMSVSSGSCERLTGEQYAIERPPGSVTRSNITFVVLFSVCLISFMLSWAFITFLVVFRRERVLTFLSENSNGNSNSKAGQNSSVSGQQRPEENDELLETTKNMPLEDLTDSAASNVIRSSPSDPNATQSEIVNAALEKNSVSPLTAEMIKFVEEIKTSYESQKEMYEASMREMHVKGENLKRSLGHENNRGLIFPHAEELNLISQKVSRKRSFLDFVLVRQMNLVNEYFPLKDAIQDDGRRETKILLQEQDNPEKTNPVVREGKYVEFREQLVTLLSTLTKESTLEGYKILLRAQDRELLNCLKELHSTSVFGNKAKRTSALHHISKVIEENVTKFLINIQMEYEHELDRNIEYLENVLLCLVNGLKNRGTFSPK